MLGHQFLVIQHSVIGVAIASTFATRRTLRLVVMELVAIVGMQKLLVDQGVNQHSIHFEIRIHFIASSCHCLHR